MEETYADNVPIETNSDHYGFVSANITMGETYADEVPNEINHDHYRFAYDIVEKVLEIRGELNPNVPRNLPEPSNYLFTEEHASIVKSLLEKDTTYLLLMIHKLANGVYDSENYLTCRDFFVRKWKKRAYTEKSFISACASIAYVAAHFTQVNYQCGALDDVVVLIACWIGDILKRGTIDHSCW
ncbi:hypothetical protein AVEN_70264-1 [Araneus ventricosus]|uniref:Uncharacterized protein n=1 Tax=Araneus ventricosus TaxID=182803 RepID=A0A4Y2GD34_ARAVE|nr:hypothetical protein AVEN_70264-1 [Araneus ventricosus]